MAIGGTLLLVSSIFVCYMQAEDLLFVLGYIVGLVLFLYLLIQIALFFVKRGAKKGTFYLESDQEGYYASEFDRDLIGKQGIARTDLKPSGHIEVAGNVLQALAKIGYIEKGSPIDVVDGKGAHLIVQPSSKNTSK